MRTSVVRVTTFRNTPSCWFVAVESVTFPACDTTSFAVSLDTLGVDGRNQGRSKYGVKRNKK